MMLLDSAKTVLDTPRQRLLHHSDTTKLQLCCSRCNLNNMSQMDAAFSKLGSFLFIRDTQPKPIWCNTCSLQMLIAALQLQKVAARDNQAYLAMRFCTHLQKEDLNMTTYFGTSCLWYDRKGLRFLGFVTNWLDSVFNTSKYSRKMKCLFCGHSYTNLLRLECPNLFWTGRFYTFRKVKLPFVAKGKTMFFKCCGNRCLLARRNRKCFFFYLKSPRGNDLKTNYARALISTHDAVS